MATRAAPFIVHPAIGGLDTVTAPTLLSHDMLSLAENIEYDTNVRKKRLGTARLNSTAVSESGSAITFTNFKDFWRYGTSRTPTQKLVATGGTQIWKMDDGDGTWDSIVTGWGTNSSQTCITIAQGYAVFSNNNGSDTPRKWNQTTASALGGSPPTFAFSVYHLRRLWVAGIASNPSLVNASAAGDIETWSGGDFLSFVLDEDDGDAIQGFSQPIRNRLYVFKGPNVGSVHELTGTTASNLSRNRIVTGAPAINHNTIITTPNDIYWMSLHGFHSLIATVKYGDTEEVFLSRPIQSMFRDLNFSIIGQSFGFWHPTRNIVGWCCPESGQTQNTITFVYNYIQGKWSYWRFSGFNPFCIGTARNPASSDRTPTLYLGDYSGRVHIGDRATLNDDDGTVAYTAKIRTPIFSRFSDAATELVEKQIYSITTFYRPKGNYSATLDVVTDTRSQSTTASMEGIGAVLGGATGFTLDTDRLGSNELTYTETPFEERTRSIELTYSVTGSNQDMEIYGYAVRYDPSESMAMERS